MSSFVVSFMVNPSKKIQNNNGGKKNGKARGKHQKEGRRKVGRTL